ncbi:MAG TPA: alpha/beta fold hydrolase [Sphingobium sp.]
MTIRAAVVAAFLAMTAPTMAQGDQVKVTGGTVVLKDFAFHDGKRLPELNVGYRTLGEPHRNARGEIDNAVMILHGTGGNGGNFLAADLAKALFGPGAPFDKDRYYVILPDAVGHGASSKPSNGLRMAFPAYDYADMVEAQKRMLTEKLGVTKLKAILGMSMGGMVTFQWATTWPDFAEKFIPMGCYPVEIGGQNRMQRKLQIDAIKGDPGWNGGNYIAQPLGGLRTATGIAIMMGASPLNLYTTQPTRAIADKALDEAIAGRLDGADANDLIYQVDASRDYNPWDRLTRIKAPLLWINLADDQVNPVSLDIAPEALKRMPNAHFVLIPASKETRGHGTLFMPQFWLQHVARFMAQ